MNQIKKMSKKKIISEILKNKYVDSININNINSLEDKELYNTIYLLKLQKKEFCDIIKKFFENNNLILQKKEK